MTNQVKGLSVNGDIVAAMDDKGFFVAGQPRYEQVPDMNEIGKTKEKLVIPVVLSDDSCMDYYPNKASIKMMAAQYGLDMDKWAGHKFEWVVTDQNVRGTMRKIMYVAPKKFNDVYAIPLN